MLYTGMLEYVKCVLRILLLECRSGYYLSNNTCRKCGHCVGNKPCNNRTGECINGCEENWMTTKCDGNDSFYQ